MIKKQKGSEEMLYCPRCQMTYPDESTFCTNCKNSRLRQPEEQDPVFLARVNSMDFLRVSGILQDHRIPFEERDDAQILLPPILAGTNLFDAKNIFVPYSALEQCQALLTGIGIQQGGAEQAGNQSQEEEPVLQKLSPETIPEPGSMPRWKRFLIRAAGVFLIAALIWAVVAASDFAFAWIKDLLNNAVRS